jgi:hypothetical protein
MGPDKPEELNKFEFLRNTRGSMDLSKKILPEEFAIKIRKLLASNRNIDVDQLGHISRL